MERKYDKEAFDKFNSILKDKIEELRADYELLKSVDRLIGECATEAKKLDLLNSVFELQDVQSKAMDASFLKLNISDS